MDRNIFCHLIECPLYDASNKYYIRTIGLEIVSSNYYVCNKQFMCSFITEKGEIRDDPILIKNPIKVISALIKFNKKNER